ncbi:MAG: RHS repeat-associated core domain-containing protein [Acidobacteriota bacterium]
MVAGEAAEKPRLESEDPIGLAGGINSFAYVGNNPQNGTDPTGLCVIKIEGYTGESS